MYRVVLINRFFNTFVKLLDFICFNDIQCENSSLLEFMYINVNLCLVTNFAINVYKLLHIE